MVTMRAANPDSAEQAASEVLSVVRDFVESLRVEFRPRKQMQQPLADIPLYTIMKARGIPEKIRSIRHRVGIENQNFDNGQAIGSSDSSSFDEQRRQVLSEIALPLAQHLASCYTILDNLPESPPPTKVDPSNGSRSRRSKNRPAPPRGMLSIQDYTDVACLLEFIVCTGILPFYKAEVISADNKSNSADNNSLIEDRLRTKLPKSLAGRIPKDALRWGTSSSSLYEDDNKIDRISLLVRTTETIAKVVVLDRFRPMLLPRHLVDIYGACFKIEYSTERSEVGNEISIVESKLYRILGLSLPTTITLSAQDASFEALRSTAIVDPTLRAMAYQTLLSSSSSPKGSKNSKLSQQGYHPWLQKRVSGLLTEMATKDLRGLSAILTVFVPVLSSSTDQTALMAGASQRLGRTLVAMTIAKRQDDQKLQGRLCQQLLQLLTMAIPRDVGGENNGAVGIPPRSMAVIQTAWSFFEHLSEATVDAFVLRKWNNSMFSLQSTTVIHESIRQVGALCAFVPPHSTSALLFLQKATLCDNESYRDCTFLGQLLRVAMLQTMNGNTKVLSKASNDAHQAVLSLTQALYVGSSGTSSKEESGRDKIVAAWILALAPTKWDLEGHSYARKTLSDQNKSPIEIVSVQTNRPLLPLTPMEEFVASIEATTARAEFFVEKIVLLLAPPSSSSSSNNEETTNILQGLPSRIFRFLLQQYLSGENDENDGGKSRLVTTVLLPILCEKCSQEQLLFGNHRDNASGLLLLIRQVLSELAVTRDSSEGHRNGDDHDDGHRQEFLKSIAGILTSLLIALMEVGSKSRSQEEEEILRSFLPILQSLSVSTANSSHLGMQNDRKDDAAMADMAAYAMSLIASRSSVQTDESRQRKSKALLSPEDRLQAILEEAEKDLGSSQPPIRAKGMVSLGRLARGFTGSFAKEQKPPSLIQELDASGQAIGCRDESIDNWIDKVLELSMMTLSDKESYVFLAAIQTIVAVGDLHPQRVLPKLASAIAQGQLTIGTDTHSTKEPTLLSQEQIIKLADALIFIIRRRAVTDEYVPLLINLMVRGGTKMMSTEDAPQKDRVRIHEETANYFATGKTTSENDADDDDVVLTQKEQWEEQDIRLKTGGPIFDIEEADVVRSLRISIVSELVASAASEVLAPHITMLANLAKEALHLEQDSRMVQRSAALLARELYARVLGEGLELTDALENIDDISSKASIPISTALVESDEEALLATLKGFSNATNTELVPDSTVVARCKEALDLRKQAENVGVIVAAKLVLEERHQLQELPALLRSIASSQSNGDSTDPVVLNPIETLH